MLGCAVGDRVFRPQFSRYLSPDASLCRSGLFVSRGHRRPDDCQRGTSKATPPCARVHCPDAARLRDTNTTTTSAFNQQRPEPQHHPAQQEVGMARYGGAAMSNAAKRPFYLAYEAAYEKARTHSEPRMFSGSGIEHPVACPCLECAEQPCGGQRP